MSEEAVRFDPGSHTYWLGERELPAVSRIIAGLYPDFSQANEWARMEAAERGTRIHALTVEYDAGTLDWFGVSDEDAAYVQAWAQFLMDTRFAVESSEERVWSATRGYAGTLDRYGVWPDGTRAVIDIKTGLPYAAHGVQGEAYARAKAGMEGWKEIPARFGLYLRADASYRVEAYTRPDDWPAFLACLAVHNWKQEHGV